MNIHTKILVADDHPSYVEGVSLLLQSFLPKPLIITALNGTEVLSQLKQNIDVEWILLDMNLPDYSGIELLKRFNKTKLIAHVIVVTAENNPDIIDQVLKLHANGFLTKNFDRKLLEKCFHTIENDTIFLTPEHARQLNDYRESILLEKEHIEESMSGRHIQTLTLIAKGYSNSEIATSLCISESTVKKHSSALLDIFEADNRTHCVAEARRLKFID